MRAKHRSAARVLAARHSLSLRGAATVAALLLLWPGAEPLLWAQDDLAELEAAAVRQAVDRVAPSVVRIESIGGAERTGELMVGAGPTTGLVVREDGYIVAAAYAFLHKPDSILVTPADGQRLAATLVATDHSRGLVLLKVVAAAPLAVPQAVPLAEIRVGQTALAVGWALDASELSVSAGIVSATGRIWGRALQTDAKVSPNNYGGPLVDIEGRVLGVLAPFALEGMGQASAVELYDSGIGFAVPLAHVESILPRWVEGRDLRPGLMGVQLLGGDPQSQPAVLGQCPPTAPAYRAGLRPGDQIVEAAGRPIVRQAHLKQVLGPLYAGDRLSLVARRGGQRIEAELELTDKLAPFDPPALGILPRRSAGTPLEPGVTVRWVFPDGPAEKAGLVAGDRITAIDGAPVADADAVRGALMLLLPSMQARLTVVRGAETIERTVELARQAELLPGPLPPAHEPPAAAAAAAETGLVDIQTPEFTNRCRALVPQTYRAEVQHGVVVWLAPPGAFREQEFVERWRPLAEQFDLIVLSPQPDDPARWQPGEARFVARALQELLSRYQIDRERIVVHGQDGGGVLAYLVALSPGPVRGAAIVNAALPQAMRLSEPAVARPPLFYITTQFGGERRAVDSSIAWLRERRFPVAVKDLGGSARYLNSDELTELCRWIDSLDRL